MRYALSRSPVLSVPLTGTVVTGPRSPATLNQPPEYPMIITTDLAINNDFSQVPNELILDDSLTDFEFRLWCRLNALRKGRAQAVFESVEQAAKACGFGVDNFRKHRRNLKAK